MRESAPSPPLTHMDYANWRRPIFLLIGFLIGCQTANLTPNQPSSLDPTSTAELPATPISLNERTVEKLSQYLQNQKEAGFRGTALIASQNNIVLAEGYGMADVDAGIPNSSATIFDIGSITKQFTGAAILKLEMAGKLTVNDPIAKYLGDMPTDKAEITIRQLLIHSAGFPEALGDDYAPISRDDFIALAKQTPLENRPGETYLYSNVGYSLLAAIIEIVSGQSYEAYLREALFLPAEMEKTGYLLPDWRDDEIAIGYYSDDDVAGKPNAQPWAEDGPYWHLRGNGGILSSAEDMFRWRQALLGNDILSDEAKQQYYAPHISEGYPTPSYYSYGWAIFPTPRETNLIAHNGGNGIFFADFWLYPSEEIVIFVATNQASRKYERLANDIAGIIFNPAYEPIIADDLQPPSPVAFPNSEQGATAEAFYNAINAGDDTTLESFISAYFSPQLFALGTMEQHINILGSLRSELEGLSLGNIIHEGDKVNLHFQNVLGETELNVTVETIPDAPTLIRSITVE